ncbi:hypothetical protein KC19_4G082100 [Ceratodon purpureus]|uniref:Uncharacterized protein n=1 Tax=Ceratodon purpureus TaxID=3225 RepID=A0A8T0I917_CERPU|nr:hypothetical protein KC19_4G082100 [Ceratodon purpureus]
MRGTYKDKREVELQQSMTYLKEERTQPELLQHHHYNLQTNRHSQVLHLQQIKAFNIANARPYRQVTQAWKSNGAAKDQLHEPPPHLTSPALKIKTTTKTTRQASHDRTTNAHTSTKHTRT